MNTDNFDDFIEDDLFELSLSGEDTISCLCFSIFEEPAEPVGTGFIVDKTGLFVSAGHNFKYDGRCLKAMFRGEVYELDLLYKEYTCREPIEFAIGRLRNFKETIQEPIIANNEAAAPGSKISLCGCKEHIVPQSEILETIELPSTRKVFKQRVDRVIPEIGVSHPLRIIVEESKGVAIPFEEIDPPQKLNGFSGGPVYIENKILGIITSHCFIKSDYWLPVLKQFQN